MKNVLLIFALLFILLQAEAQQRPQFSQYLFNGVYINPAYSGYKESLYLHSFFRSQWTGMEGAPKTMSLALDGAINDGKVGLSLLVNHDQVGAQLQTSAYANYAYKLKMGYYENARLAFGLGVGAVQLGLDGTRLHAAEEEDMIPTGMESKILPDARAGIFYSDPAFFAGFSADNMLAGYFKGVAQNSSIIPIAKPHLYLTAGGIFNLNDMLQLKPSFLLKEDLGGPSSLDLNAFALVNKKIWLGIFYRSTVEVFKKPYIQPGMKDANAMGLVTEFFTMGNLRIGYAFDYSFARTLEFNSGSHEFSIGILFNRRGDSYANKGMMLDFPY